MATKPSGYIQTHLSTPRFSCHLVGRFVRHFADVRKEVERGVAAYVHAVKDGSFPDPEREGYAIGPSEWEAFLRSQGMIADTTSHREEMDSAETAQPIEFRTSAPPRASETDEKMGKKGELHTL